jgi:hypothetical protein
VSRLAAVLALAATCALLAAASGAAASTSCGTVRWHGTSYPVKVTRGSVRCTIAKAVMLRFLDRQSSARGWLCFRGHSTDAWAASCAGLPGGPRQGVLVRAYRHR